MDEMKDYDVIVIGAGIGGLCAGSLLAHQGRRVLVVEQSNRVGGCCSTYDHDGYKIDIGASIIEFANVIDWAFQRMGTSVFEEVDLVPVDPTFTARLYDGSEISFPLDLKETENVFAEVAPEDLDGWKRYAEVIEGFLDAALGGFFTTPASTMGDAINLFRKSPALLKYGSLFSSSYEDVIRRYFTNEKIIEAFSFHSFYAGLPPALLPGHFGMLPYSEHHGVYYAKGGMISIPKGFQKCGERAGMKVLLECTVKKVLVENGRVSGLQMADGTQITCDVVVSNINAKKLYTDMVDQQYISPIARRGLASYKYSMATPMLYLCLNSAPALKDHHTLMTRPMHMINDYWFNQYEKGRFPSEQFGILSWTTKSDPGLAPKGHHIIAVTLAPGTYRLAGTTWDEAKEMLKDQIIKYLEEKYLPGLRDQIVYAIFSTPLDFERQLLSPEGAIYALRQDLFNSLMFRPAARSKHVKGLYLTGASTHPGGGVPTTSSSGIIAADLIAKYEQ
jgi:phytoene desaturase